MGSAVANVLRRAGHRVVTSLRGRSAASCELARKAGMEDVGSLEALFEASDVFLSILPPSAADGFAREAAPVIAALGCELTYADCNAVAPSTVRRIAGLFTGGPAAFVDVGIVGPAPRPGAESPTRFYVSGPARDRLLPLAAPEITQIDMGDAIGSASALKMCYAAMNKGVDALYTDILLAARRLDVEQALLREFDGSQQEAARRMARRIPFLAATAARFTGEMIEIAETFDAAGVSGDFHRGAAWVYELLSRSALAAETRATLPAERSLAEALAALEAVLAHDEGNESVSGD
jgi:3-hydroxyisobutyrate dehydrogenase-like beta-hydroxyacid dehydrogenase